MNITYTTSDQTRSYILSKIIEEKQKGQYRVIDIGGVAGGGWTAPVTDMVLDIKAEDTEKSLNIDICDSDSWKKIEEIVERDGLFDYAICTHTLEDLYNPITALKKMPKIAKRGVITMPAIHTELCRIESQSWVGYIHHRWIFDKKDNKMLLVPKINMIESVAGNKFPLVSQEIRYEWEDNIPFKIFMDNYLGPNVQTVLNNYQSLIDNALVK